MPLSDEAKRALTADLYDTGYEERNEVAYKAAVQCAGLGDETGISFLISASARVFRSDVYSVSTSTYLLTSEDIGKLLFVAIECDQLDIARVILSSDRVISGEWAADLKEWANAQALSCIESGDVAGMQFFLNLTYQSSQSERERFLDREPKELLEKAIADGKLDVARVILAHFNSLPVHQKEDIDYRVTMAERLAKACIDHGDVAGIAALQRATYQYDPEMKRDVKVYATDSDGHQHEIGSDEEDYPNEDVIVLSAQALVDLLVYAVEKNQLEIFNKVSPPRFDGSLVVRCLDAINEGSSDEMKKAVFLLAAQIPSHSAVVQKMAEKYPLLSGELKNQVDSKVKESVQVAIKSIELQVDRGEFEAADKLIATNKQSALYNTGLMATELARIEALETLRANLSQAKDFLEACASFKVYESYSQDANITLLRTAVEAQLKTQKAGLIAVAQQGPVTVVPNVPKKTAIDAAVKEAAGDIKKFCKTDESCKTSADKKTLAEKKTAILVAKMAVLEAPALPKIKNPKEHTYTQEEISKRLDALAANLQYQAAVYDARKGHHEYFFMSFGCKASDKHRETLKMQGMVDNLRDGRPANLESLGKEATDDKNSTLTKLYNELKSLNEWVSEHPRVASSVFGS